MAANGREDVTPQDVWAVLHELSASQRDTDRRMQETDRRMQETDRRMQETDRLMQETGRRMDDNSSEIRRLNEVFTSHWGKLMEALVDGDLIKLLSKRGITVDYTFNNLKRDHDGRTWEIDILAANGTEVVVVEVKTTLKVRDVDHFLQTLRHFHRLMPEYGGKLAYGAVAYLKADESSAVYAEKQGLFVIRATGSSASITNRRDFRPRAFGGRSPAPATPAKGR